MLTSMSLLPPICYCLWTGSVNIVALSLPIGSGLLFLVSLGLYLKPYNYVPLIYGFLLILAPGDLLSDFLLFRSLFLMVRAVVRLTFTNGVGVVLKALLSDVVPTVVLMAIRVLSMDRFWRCS